MTRLGWLVLLLFAIIVAGFLSVVRFNEGGPPPILPSSGTQAIRAPSGLAIPVAGVAPAQLYDSFGDVRGERRHGAIDIPAPLGTVVVAAAVGRVEKLFDSEAGGRTIYVRSPDRRFVYYYAHLDRYAAGLREGAEVAGGQPIATVGASGNADPAAPHLHFEIKLMAPGEVWYQGRAINPYPLLAGERPTR